MQSSTPQILKPFLSVLIIIGVLFFIVFIKMETRRMGYQVHRESQVLQSYLDESRIATIRLAKLTRLSRIEEIAQKRFELRIANKGQIIQMVGTQVALHE